MMNRNWPSTELTNEMHVIRVLAELRGKRWMCRGHSRCYGGLVPSIDRGRNLPRVEKLTLERQSIDHFRSTARFFAADGERRALTDDLVALMVLRHYRVPTRLLDWSLSPYVAAYFASCKYDADDGEIWAFDQDRYLLKGKQQWRRWKQTTIEGDRKSFQAALTAFTIKEPPDWFVCYYYNAFDGFPRQNAQDGAYSLTARFGRDHADALANLLARRSYYHRYVVPASLKPELRTFLRERHGIWEGSLFPDSAGAADCVQTGIFDAPAAPARNARRRRAR
jgi:hypothetical protein